MSATTQSRDRDPNIIYALPKHVHEAAERNRPNSGAARYSVEIETRSRDTQNSATYSCHMEVSDGSRKDVLWSTYHIFLGG